MVKMDRSSKATYLGLLITLPFWAHVGLFCGGHFFGFRVPLVFGMWHFVASTLLLILGITQIRNR
jgi:hypothetical protein